MADPSVQSATTVPHTQWCPVCRLDHVPRPGQVQTTVTPLSPGVLALATAGEVDVATLAQWRDALTAAITAPRLRLLLCDCTHLRFFSIGGFGALVDADNAARRRGVEIQVVNPPATLLRLLTLTQHAPQADADLVTAAATLATLVSPDVQQARTAAGARARSTPRPDTGGCQHSGARTTPEANAG